MGFNQGVQAIEVLFVPFVLTGGLSDASGRRLRIVPHHLFAWQRLSRIANTHRFLTLLQLQHRLTQLILGPKRASTVFTCSIICYMQINRHLFSTWVQTRHLILLNVTTSEWLLDALGWLGPLISSATTLPWLLRSPIWSGLIFNRIAQSIFECFNLSLVLAQNVIAVLVILAFHCSLHLRF